MTAKRKIKGGLYLVVDPALELEFILPKIEQAIKGGVDVVQIWNNWQEGQNKNEVVDAICSLAHSTGIPVLINEEWQLLQNSRLDGVHFDNIPADIKRISSAIGRPFICGITCGNELDRIEWADKNNLDYVSFCSMFPSASAGVCEIVTKETVVKARAITSLLIFVAGGITLSNVEELKNTGIDGIALISSVMKAEDATKASQAFKEKLLTLEAVKHETIIG